MTDPLRLSSERKLQDEKEAQMKALMMADLGIENRNRITSIPEPEDEIDVDFQALQLNRRVALEDKVKINAWNNAHEILKDDESTDDDDIALGQTHRARLIKSLEQGGLGEENFTQGHYRSGKTARQSRGGGVGRERGRGDRTAHYRSYQVADINTPPLPSTRGGLSASGARVRENVNISPQRQHVRFNVSSPVLPSDTAPAVKGRRSAPPFDPSRLVSPAAFFASVRPRPEPSQEKAPSPEKVPSSETIVPLPSTPDTNGKRVRETSSKSRLPGQAVGESQGVQEPDLDSPQKLPPHLRRGPPARTVEQVTPTFKSSQQLEDLNTGAKPRDSKEKAAESNIPSPPSPTDEDVLGATQAPTAAVTSASSVQPTAHALPSLIDDDVPIDFNTPSLKAHQGSFPANDSTSLPAATSYSNDLRDIDFTQSSSVEPQASLPYPTGGMTPDETTKYIFDRITQLTSYMPDQYRQEAVSLLKAASGLAISATSTETEGKSLSTGQDASALSSVSLERTATAGTGGQGQTKLSQDEVRTILARGPVAQNEAQIAKNVQINMRLGPSSGSPIIVPLLQPGDHPVFRDTAITRHYAWIGPNEPLPAVIIFKEDTTSTVSRTTGPSSKFRGQQPRSLALMGEELPQFRHEIIPHKLPDFIVEAEKRRAMNTARGPTVNEPATVVEPPKTEPSKRSIFSSMWAATKEMGTSQGSMSHKANIEALSTQSNTQTKPNTTDVGAAARAQYTRLTTPSTAGALDPGAAARAQYSRPPLISSSREEDFSAAARLQYIGARRVYDDDGDTPVIFSAGNPFANATNRGQRDDIRGVDRSSNATS